MFGICNLCRRPDARKNGIVVKQDVPAANLQRFKEFGMHK